MHFLTEVEPHAVFDKPFVPNYPEMLSDEFAQWKDRERIRQSIYTVVHFREFVHPAP